ncbi:hypothetical protein ACFO5K_20605 [Nocardia halotolerans]|uniref:Uncharacterized protein n=1 Tax=Nocardia halotolerans TaxID=1755878 RepID=A0ABV8VL21_9NOCA
MARSVPQPPFPSELLADLHADNLAPELCEQLWPMVRSDPDALRYLNELDQVNTHLRALGDDDRVVHRMPDDVAERMFGLLAELDAGDGPTERLSRTEHPSSPQHLSSPEHPSTPGHLSSTQRLSTPGHLSSTQHLSSPEHLNSPERPHSPEHLSSTQYLSSPKHPSTPAHLSAVPSPTPEPGIAAEPAPISLARHRSRRRMRLLAAAAATVAVLAGAGAVFTTLDTTENGTPTAAPFLDPADPGDDLTVAAALSALGKRDVRGPLADDAALTRCVRANGIDRTVLGASSITFRGDEAVLVLVNGARTPTITALVVGTDCTTGAPNQLAVRDIG